MLADLHIHSRFSRATSGDCDAPHLELLARTKGLSLIGTGDFTHPAWREELSRQLEEAGDGVYRLKAEYRLPGPEQDTPPLFLLSGEISTIYKKDGKTRKVHHLFLLPSLSAAEDVAHRLEVVGNLHSDGRPILGMDSRDLLETVLQACLEAVYIPAHIWTPHFSLFGAFSQFSALEECYGDLTGLVHAVETGLSSDPEMNRRVSMLDGLQLISNSDAHSPAKLGREATVFSCAPAFPLLKRAVETGDGLAGTIEFFPEEGKYHLDGHRACRCCLEPEQTRRLGGLCPVCGRKLTVGVLSRVEDLADRSAAPAGFKPFESLMPLAELLGETLGVSAASKRVSQQYQALVQALGSEFHILRETSLSDARIAGGEIFAEALKRLRQGRVLRQGGYDGEYGVIRLFAPGEREALRGQMSLLPLEAGMNAKKTKAHAPQPAPVPPQPTEEAFRMELNPEQRAAAESDAAVTVVSAGPGTGKTQTLIARIEYLIAQKQVAPEAIAAITFTRQAAQEMRQRLEQRLGKKAAKKIHVATFHSLCLALLPKKPLISPAEQRAIMEEILRERGEKMSPAQAIALVSALKNGMAVSAPAFLLPAYQAALAARGQRDLEDLLLDALAQPGPRFSHVLADEFQDVNALQRRLARHWAQGGSLFAIGDADQSIYGFRGADAGCFAALLRDFPDARSIRLLRNYRSAPEILVCARAVIEQNPGGERPLLPMRKWGMPVRLVRHGDAYREAEWIAREIEGMTGGMDMLSSGAADRPARAFSDIAVLARTHRQLDAIEKALNQAGIPCQVSGRGDYLEDETVQAALSFFSALLGNPAALPCALQGLWHCGPALCDQARHALETQESWQETLHAWDALSPFLTAVSQTLPGIRREKPRKLLDTLLAQSAVSSPALEKLRQLCAFYSDMPALLAAMETGEEGDVVRLCGGKKAGAVRVMTFHAAKGLEFPAVILAGLGEENMPLRHAGEETNAEEERRLLFVGMTRAREELILSVPGAPSSFLSVLPSAVQQEDASRPWQPRQKQLSLF